MFPVLSLVTMLPWCRWCEAAACYQYQWVVRDGDVFCQRSDGLRVDSKTVLFHSLINKIMFSISSHNFMGAKRTWGRMEGRMKASVGSTKIPMLKFLIYQTFSIHNSHCRFMYFLRCTPRSCRHRNMYPFIFEGESGKDVKINIEEKNE